MRHLLIILSISLFSFLHGQIIDITGDKITIREFKSKKALFVIDWEKAYFQKSKISSKEKLGSYNISFKKGKPKSEFKIIKHDKQSIIWRNGDLEVQMQLKNIDHKKIKLTISSNQDYTHWHIPFIRNPQEEIYGGGIQFSGYSDLNKTIINLSQENGIGRGGGSISKWTSLAGVKGESFATYCPLPMFTTNSDRSYSWNEYAYSEVKFDNNFINFDIFDKEVSFTLGYDISMHEIHSINNAFPYKLPDWSLGTILGAQGGSKNVLDKLNALINADVNVKALWIQDWVGKQPTKFGSRLNWTWQLDRDHYINFESFKSDLRKKNIKLLGYINPFFAENGPYINEGIAKTYFVSEKGIAQKFEFGGIKGYMLDLFNDDAYSWMKSIIQTNLVDQGFSGWMADFAEWYPIGKDPMLLLKKLKMHNEYPVLWAKLNYEIIKENQDKELFFFNRSGCTGTEQYSSMMWAGDQMVDYSIEDGLGSVFDAYLSASYSELPIIHSDVGGYTSVKKPLIKNYIRKKQLLKDWMLLEAFTPVFRTHEGLLPEDNIQVYSDSAIINTFKKFSDINHSLLPYFKHLIKEKEEEDKQIISHINHTIKNFQTKNTGFCVGDQIIIIHQKEYEDYNKLQKLGWKFVNNNGELILIPNKNAKIIVAVKKLDTLFN